LSASLGVGWLVLLAGIALGGLTMRKQIAATVLGLFALLVSLRLADKSVYDTVSPFFAI
jgi:hypothetical protein